MSHKKKEPVIAEYVHHAFPGTTGTTLDSERIYDHYNPSVRLLRIRKTVTGSCGFHLTRTKWDPYPWVSAVDPHTAAEMSGLKAGDCVLEVNGEDVLGLRITDIAKLVQAKSEHVTLLLWNCGSDFECDPESVCCAPMPRTLQRLTTIVQSILNIIECPVCLDTITPPALQCQNGHLLCLNCRIRAEKCPVCRDRYTPQRALIAEKIYAAITSAYNLCSTNEGKLRQKLFGVSTETGRNVMNRRWRRAEGAKQTIDDNGADDQQVKMGVDGMKVKKRLSTLKLARAQQYRSQHVAPGGGQPGRFSFRKEVETEAAKASRDASVAGQSDKNKKILMKLWHRKAASMENLSTTTKTSGNVKPPDRASGADSAGNGLPSDGTTTPMTASYVKAVFALNTMRLSTKLAVTNDSDEAVERTKGVIKNSKDHLYSSVNNGDETNSAKKASITTTTREINPPSAMPMNCSTTMKTILNTASANDVAHVNAMSKLLSATKPTTNDISAMPQPHASFPHRLSANENNRIKEGNENVKNSHKQQHVQPHLQLSTSPGKYLPEQSLNLTSSATPPCSTWAPEANSTIAVEHCPSWLHSQLLAFSKFKDYNNSNFESCSCPSSSLLFVDKQRPARKNKPCWSTAATAATSISSVDFNDSTHSRKNSTSSGSNSSSKYNDNGNGNDDINWGSDIVDSSHSILTPASSLSSGVFFSSLESNELAATTTEQCIRQLQQHSEITVIKANKNALLSEIIGVGQPLSIASSLRSLSSLVSSSASEELSSHV